jgi:hypothetical protein
VAGNQNTSWATKIGASHDRVGVSDYLEVRVGAKRSFDQVGERLLVPRHTLHIADLAGQFHRIDG